LWRPKVCGYIAARANDPALRPNRSRQRGFWKNGAIAQLGERFNGIEEVVGSIPSGSTISRNRFNGLRRSQFDERRDIWVRIPNRYQSKWKRIAEFDSPDPALAGPCLLQNLLAEAGFEWLRRDDLKP
jgi:hypothetical protein